MNPEKAGYSTSTLSFQMESIYSAKTINTSLGGYCLTFTKRREQDRELFRTILQECFLTEASETRASPIHGREPFHITTFQELPEPTSSRTTLPTAPVNYGLTFLLYRYINHTRCHSPSWPSTLASQSRIGRHGLLWTLPCMRFVCALRKRRLQLNGPLGDAF
jgi:hypothetical protein